MVHGHRQKPGDVGGGDVAEAEERGAASVGDEGIEAVAAGGRRRRDAGAGEEARARHQAPQRRPALPRVRRRRRRRRRYVVARDQRDLGNHGGQGSIRGNGRSGTLSPAGCRSASPLGDGAASLAGPPTLVAAEGRGPGTTTAKTTTSKEIWTRLSDGAIDDREGCLRQWRLGSVLGCWLVP